MPSFFRSPRTLAGWLELDYFRRRGLFRGWWGGSLMVAAVAALVGLGVLLGATGQRTFQAGPLSAPHALFNDRCELCHQERGSTLTRLWRGDKVASVPDTACLACHSGAPHNPPHATMGSCVSCHREHRGHANLVRVADSHCAQCHEDLKRPDGNRSFFHGRVVSFDDQDGHPPFRRWSGGSEKDPGTLRFNHAVHLVEGRIIVAGNRTQREKLECAACHQPDVSGRRMKPISFDAHCQRCHPLSVQLAGTWDDPELRQVVRTFADRPIRHPSKSGSAADVRADLRQQLARLIEGPIGERFLAARQPTNDRRFPLPAADAPREEKEFAWVGHQLAQTERVLFEGAGGCRYCHTPEPPGRTVDALPLLQPTNIRDRWWEHARFNHAAHRLMTCEQCHDAKHSAKTSDVLLPGLDLCLTCHNTKSKHATARADCVECHVYHDPKASRAPRDKDRLSLEEILGR